MLTDLNSSLLPFPSVKLRGLKFLKFEASILIHQKSYKRHQTVAIKKKNRYTLTGG